MKQEYFEFANGVKIVAGKGSLEQLPNILTRYDGYRVFIISDEIIKSFGHIDAVKNVLAKKEELTIGGTYLDVKSYLTVKDVEKLYTAYRKSGSDSSIGIGGSRVMNAAKALALLISTKSKNIADFRGIDNAVREQMVPFMLIPTTFGSGSEVSKTAVVIDEDKEIPIEIVTEAMQPQYCFLDPSFLKTLPEKEIYMSLIDVMAYSIESYISTRANSLTKSFSKMAMFLIKDNFQKAIVDNDDRALSNLQRASAISAITYSNTYTGVAHAIANSLAARYQIHRGEAICAVLVASLDQIKGMYKEKFAEMLLFYRGTQDYATSTTDERCEAFMRIVSNVIEHLASDYGIKIKLSDYGVKEDDLASLAELTLQDGELIGAPKQYTKEDILEVLRQSL